MVWARREDGPGGGHQEVGQVLSVVRVALFVCGGVISDHPGNYPIPWPPYRHLNMKHMQDVPAWLVLH